MAMHCPQCLTEYRDGFSECADCHVPLVPGRPPDSPAVGHAADLVTVMESSDPFAVSLGKSTLQDAGIRFVVGGDDADERGLTGLTPMGAGASRIQVEAACADQARDLLEPLLHPEPIPEDAENL
jgi:Putative prokaryotic signal transducing protein